MILDINMPGLGGAQTLARLRVTHPTTPLLLSTGRVDHQAKKLVSEHAEVSLLSKPFSLTELRQQIERVAKNRR